MSGHSKWSKIQRAKGANDAKRGALFTRVGNLLSVAARAGTDPKINTALALAIEKAKSINMPLSNIERAIKRVSDKDASLLKEFTYEARGPGGIGIIIEVATDNQNRTLPEVNTVLNKNGGRMAEPGSVLFQFDRVGIIEVQPVTEEQLLQLLDCGANDVIESDESTILITDASLLHQVSKNVLALEGFNISNAELSYLAKKGTEVSLNDEDLQKLEKLIDAIEGQQDVVNVYHNAL